MAKRDIEDRFLAIYLEDVSRDRVRSLAEYQALFPGYETRIAREYEHLEEDEHGVRPEELTDSERPHRTVGRYRILGELGRGGQAPVYRAHDPRLSRDVALKVLRTNAFGDVDAQIRRFRREAEVTAKLDHPGICGALDVGEDRESGVIFFAMRLIDGRTLADLIADDLSRSPAPGAVSLPSADSSEVETGAMASRIARRDMQVSRILQVIEKVARALHVAHEQGLVHRDIKPGNIMITGSGEPVIVDFGLARDESSAELGLTNSGELLGTAYYMSPEQVRGESEIDRRTDIYSLGVTLFECLTLQRPFKAASRESLYWKITNDPLPNPSRLNRTIPSDLRIVLETALDKDRDQRYGTALEFADDLRRVQRFQPIHASPLPLTLRAVRWTQRNPAMTAFVAVLSVALVLTLYLLRTVQARNIELEKIRVADTFRGVAKRLELGEFRGGIARELRDGIEQEHRESFSYRWLEARTRRLPRIAPPVTETRPNCDRPLRWIAFDGSGERLLTIDIPEGESRPWSSVTSGRLRYFEIGTGEWSEPLGLAQCACFSPDHRLILYGDSLRPNSGISLLDSATKEPMGERVQVEQPVVAVAFSRDGRHAAAADVRGELRLFEVHPDQRPVLRPIAWSVDALGFRVQALDFSPDGRRLLVAGDSDSAWILKLPPAGGATGATRIRVFSGEESRRIGATYNAARVLSARFSPDGRFVLVSGAMGRVALFRAHDGARHREFDAHRQDDNVLSFATEANFDAGGRCVLSCGFDRILSVRDTRTGRRLSHISTGQGLAIARDPASGSRIAIASARQPHLAGPGDLKVFDLGDLPLPLELIGPAPRIHQLVVSSDRRRVYSLSTVGWGVHMHELATGEQRFAIYDPVRRPQWIDLRPPDERELAIGYESGDCHIVDAETGKVLRRRRLPREDVRLNTAPSPFGIAKLGYSPDGKVLAAGLGCFHVDTDYNQPVPVFLLDPDHLGALDGGRLLGQRGNIQTLSFDASGSRLLSIDTHGQLMIWDVATRRQIASRKIRRPRFQRVGDLYPCELRDEDSIVLIDPASGAAGTALGIGSESLWSLDLRRRSREALWISGRRAIVTDFDGNERLVLPTKRPPGFSLCVARFVGDEGVILGGMETPLSYHEVEPNPERYGERQLQWRAGRVVSDLLEEHLLPSVAMERLESNRQIDDEVRRVAKRILARTSGFRAPGVVAFGLLGSAPGRGFTPGRSPRDYSRAIQLLEASRAHQKVTGAFDEKGDRVITSAIAVARYELGEFSDAIQLLKRAASISVDPDHYSTTAYSRDFLRDFESLPNYYLALAEHAVGADGAEGRARVALEAAWKSGIGGAHDAGAARYAYRMLKLGPSRSVGERSPGSAAIGPPDASRWNGGDAAWYPRSKSGDEALRLEFAVPVTATGIAVFETDAPGATVEVVLENGRDEIASFEIPTGRDDPGRVQVDFEALDGVSAVRLRLKNQRRDRGGGRVIRTGIDAVQLLDRNGRSHWPIRASVIDPNR